MKIRYRLYVHEASRVPPSGSAFTIRHFKGKWEPPIYKSIMGEDIVWSIDIHKTIEVHKRTALD